ncbi:MAG TPA: radical SAM protein [archaeon]|nr:radical SAM protein [archaeon]
MKILLVKLNQEADEIIPPIGLGYLANAVRKNHSVRVLDCLKEKISLAKLLDFLQEKKPGLVGILFFTMNYYQVKETAFAIRKRFPSMKIIVGGPHPSALPKETLKEIPEIDFAFAGEAEIGFPMLADALEKKNPSSSSLEKIPSLVWRKKNGVIVNPNKVVENLDELGFPAWDLLKPETYPMAPHGSFFRQFPVAPIIITRGCPYGCTFCGGHLVSGKRIRSRSLESVMQEIRLLVKEHGIREIHIEDDNFTFKRKFVEDFCNALLKEKLGITWACPNGMRLDTLDRELIFLMKKSGLHTVSVGIESGSERILKLVKKSLNKKQIREKVELIDSAGLNVIGFFMLGFPTETRKEIEETIDFACSLPLKRIAFSCMQPFPGTEVYNSLLESGEIEKVNWETCFLFKATYSPKGLSIEELQKLRKQGLRKFYFRPKIIFSMLGEINSPKQVFFVAKRAVHWLFRT